MPDCVHNRNTHQPRTLDYSHIGFGSFRERHEFDGQAAHDPRPDKLQHIVGGSRRRQLGADFERGLAVQQGQSPAVRPGERSSAVVLGVQDRITERRKSARLDPLPAPRERCHVAVANGGPG